MDDFLAIAYLLLCGLVAVIARGTGRSPLLWFLICFLLTPLLALPLLVLISGRHGD